MKMNFKIDPVVLYEPHKKIRQKIDLLLCNPNFKKDVSRLRALFRAIYNKSAFLTRETIRIGLLPGDTKREMWRHSLKLNKHFFDIENNKILAQEVSKMLKKYQLEPQNIWFQELRYFIINNYFIPALSSMETTVSHESLKVIDTDMGLFKQNFRIWVDSKRGLCVQIFNDTSLADVRRGWKYVERAKKVYYDKTRFYPLKNLNLAKKILDLDNGTEQTDWAKQNEIFGDTDSFSEEDKGIRKIKQTRHQYKKRFGLKS